MRGLNPRPLLIVTIVVSILLTAAAACRDGRQAQAPGASATPPVTITSSSPVPGPRQIARVLRVIDGDTILVSLDGREERVRYIGVDTPETVAPDRPVGCFGAEASEANRQLVAEKTVELERDISERDRFGRLLRYVYVDGIFVNAELVRRGYATAVTFPPDVRESTRFRDLERRAREAGQGLWGACKP
jgi:micrococcal nuclease